MAVDKLLDELSLAARGTVWGFKRVQEGQGVRKLKSEGARFVPVKVPLADQDETSMGQILQGPLDNFVLSFQYALNGQSLEPQNGDNCAAWCLRKKLIIACGRVVRMV